jgi:hypothetical protein
VSKAEDTFKDMHILLETNQITRQAQQNSALIRVILTSVHHSLLSGLSEPTSSFRQLVIYLIHTVTTGEIR